MARIKTTDRFSGGQGIASNDLDVVYGDLIEINSGYIEKITTGKLEGLSVETKVFEADNETVKKSKIQYMRIKDETQFELDATASLTQANVGQAFNVDANGECDVATAGTGTQVMLRELTGDTVGIFVRA